MSAWTRRVSGRIARTAGLVLAPPALVLGLVVAGGVTTATAAATWLPITDVSAGGQEARDPQVDVSADGRRVMAVWYRLDAGSGRYLIQVGRSLDGGATWLAPQDLSATAQDWRYPRVAMSDDGSRAVVVWQGWDRDVWSRSTQDGGATWTAAQQLSSGPDATNPHVVVSYDGLRVTVAWDDVVPVPEPGLWYAAVIARSSTDGGVTWRDPVRVSPAHDQCDGVKLVATPDGMRVTAVWLAAGHTAVGVGVSPDGGSNWNISTVTTSSAAVWDTDVATSADGIDVAVVWGMQPAYARVSHDGGGSWAPVVILDPTGYWPRLTMSGDGQRLTALWYTTDAEYHMWTVARSSTDRGGTWSSPQHLSATLDPSPTGFNRPLLAGAGDRVTAFWSRGNNPPDSSSYDTLQAAETTDGGATWSAAVDLSVADRHENVVAAAASADGSAVTAVWEEWDSTQTTTTRIRSRSKASPPSIVTVTPTSGPATGGTSVGILGSGFGGATSVTFGGTPAASFTVWSSTHITATSPPGAPGTVGITVTTAAGSTTLPSAFTYVAVDTTPPVTRMVTPASPVAFSSTLRLTFSGRDVGGSMATYQVQRAVKPPGAALGGYANFGAPRTAASVTMTGAKPGYGYCFRVRGTDTAGNVSAWSAAACETMPGDDRVLVGRTGWSRPVVKTAYLRTLTTSRTKGATLVLAKSRGSALVLVVNKVPGGGTLGVYVKGKRVATVPTSARRAASKVPVVLKVRTAGVPVVLRLDAPGTRGVAIDGIAQLP